MSAFTKSIVELAALKWFRDFDIYLPGPSIALGEPGEKRADYSDLVLLGKSTWREIRELGYGS